MTIYCRVFGWGFIIWKLMLKSENLDKLILIIIIIIIIIITIIIILTCYLCRELPNYFFLNLKT